MPRPTSYELWSDLVGAATPGTRLGTLTKVLKDPGPIEFRHIRRIEYTFELEIGRSDPLYSSLAEEKVIRVQNSSTATDFDEWRIRTILHRIARSGAKFARVECVAPVYDLDRSGLIEFVAADGQILTHFPAGGKTATAILNIALGNTTPYTSAAPSHFKIGTIDATDPLDAFVFQDDTAWTVITELAKASGKEVDWDRDPADDQYRIHLRTRIGSGATEVPLRLKRNVFEFDETTSSDRQATRIHPRGGSIGGEVGTIANNAFEIQSVGAPVTMIDDFILENDQLNLMGVYAEKPGGTLVAVTDCVAPNLITIDTSGLSAGDKLRFRRNAAGDDMDWLSSPSAEALIPNPPITSLLARGDIPPIDNEISNGFLDQWSGGLPVGHGVIGTATISENANELHINYGTRSARVVCPLKGDGISVVAISVSPTSRRPHFTPQIWLEVITGKVELRLVDRTSGLTGTPITYPADTAVEKAQTPGLGWQGIGIQHGIDHFTNGKEPGVPTDEFDLEIVSTESGTEFYLDADLLTNTFSGVEFDAFLAVRGANLLWMAGNDELFVRRNSLSTYAAIVADLNRSNAVKYPNEPFDLGADARIAEVMPAEISTRIIGRREFKEHPARSELELETEEELLTRILTERKHFARRAPVLDHLKPPACDLNFGSTAIGGDLVAVWDRGNWGSVEVRDISGLTGSPVAKWDAGTRLYVGANTRFILLAGETPDPALITEIMIETYNRWGKPGFCYEASTPVRISLPGTCINLIQDGAAATKHCSGVPTSGEPPILLRPSPIVIDLANISGQVEEGVTPIAICHFGSSIGSGSGLPDGFYFYVWSAITNFIRSTLGQVNDGDGTVLGSGWATGPTTYADMWSGVTREDLGTGSSDVRGGGSEATTTAKPDYVASGCCQVTSSLHQAELLFPGILNDGTGTIEVRYSQGFTRPHWTCSGLSTHKIGVKRDAIFKTYLAAATQSSSGTFTGTAEWGLLDGNDIGGGRWDEFRVLNGANVVQATFLKTDHPDGRVSPGDIYVYDPGAGLVVGVGGVIAINAAATLGLTESGFTYEEDWTALAGQTIDLSKYLVGGTPTIDAGGLGLLLGPGEWILRIDRPAVMECVAEAVVDISSTSERCGAAIMTGGPDTRAALRLTWDDPAVTTVLSPGVGTGNDLDVFIQERAYAGIWPVGATSLTIEQLQVGADVGLACSDDVTMVVGSGCCQTTIILPDLPPVSLDCLLPSPTMTFWQLTPCAAGNGLGVVVSGFLRAGPTCPDINNNALWVVEFRFHEEYDPAGQPGQFFPTLIFTDLLQNVLSGQTIPTAPGALAFSWAGLVTNEDPLGVSPVVGAVRASDGLAPVPHQWFCEIVLKGLGNQSGVQTSAHVTSPAYGWCP